MKSTLQYTVKPLFGLLLLLLLSACGSELTGINAPDAVEDGVPFQVSVTHQFLGEDQSQISPGSTPYGALVFGVFAPTGYSANPLANYQGTWDGVDIDLDLQLQPGIPATNLIEFLGDDVDPEELLLYIQESDCSTFVDAISPETGGFQLHFYQTTDDLYLGPEPIANDGGEFTFELTPGGHDGLDQVVVIHGLLLGGPGGDGDVDPDVDVLGCQWYPDLEIIEDEEFIPDSEIAGFARFATESLPVPVMGGAMIAVLALMLALAGIYAGRRRTQQ